MLVPICLYHVHSYRRLEISTGPHMFLVDSGPFRGSKGRMEEPPPFWIDHGCPPMRNTSLHHKGIQSKIALSPLSFALRRNQISILRNPRDWGLVFATYVAGHQWLWVCDIWATLPLRGALLAHRAANLENKCAPIIQWHYAKPSTLSFWIGKTSHGHTYKWLISFGSAISCPQTSFGAGA